MAGAPVEAQQNPWRGRFEKLQAINLQYTYPGGAARDAFTIGPVALTLRAGETIFIVGGNGSGKSTLVKVLTGLYMATAGALHIDGVPLGPHNVQAYREMIAAIFSDFHLFQKLYGLAGVSEEAVGKLLAQMQIDHKTTFSNGSLSTLELSTGQRKRLAMVIALLEDRPIYVFDEWAADQDPEFRRYYYEGLLPELKRRGKTVIAISHDDRYFHCADRVLRMEEGRVRWEGVVPPPLEPASRAETK
jgi:putative ATP-binding cassette transporter